ncbi:uncharacterized protein LOC120178329 [Hibiscus syriacus]|uniref:uncharacterized protein LOC120178329 n=1 Tax=Hibiscus syriacus TaxID=106335 RepID=UPI001923AF70|nr:uncharacterized protein LOC120178329 [Hibiscus syriacus]
MAYISRNVSNTDRSLNIGTFLMNLGKFALDLAINFSLKGFTGGKKLYQTIVQERLKDEGKRLKLEDVKVIEEKRQSTKMEDNKQQSKTVTDKGGGGSDPLKKIPQGLKEWNLRILKGKQFSFELACKIL